MDSNNSFKNSSLFGGNNHNNSSYKERRDEKRGYKKSAESAADALSSSYIAAKRNNTLDDFVANGECVGPINRYYDHYWFVEFRFISLVALFVTFIFSFKTPFAACGLFAVFALHILYSKQRYAYELLSHQNISTKDREFLRNKLFPSQIVISELFIATSVLFFIEALCLKNSRAIFLDPNNQSVVIDVMKSFQMNFDMELFAYTNAIAILGLIVVKIFERNASGDNYAL